MKELTDNERNAILQTAIIRAERGQKGAPASFTPEEKACYEGFEEQILSDIAMGRKPNYSITSSYDDW